MIKLKSYILIFIIIFLIIILIISACITTVHLYKEKRIKIENDNLFKYQKCIRISDDPIIYISRKDTGQEDFYKYMESQGYKVINEEQLGKLHIFKKGNEQKEITLDYTEYYAEWTFNN